MTSRSPRTGLCVLRVEEQDSYLLISVTVQPDLARSPDPAVLWSADVDQALTAVREFLRTFEAPIP